MIGFGIKDILDILIVGALLFYLYKMMKSSGTISLFYGVLLFILIWVMAAEILNMRLTGTILDKFMSIGLIVLVILFQDQIKKVSHRHRLEREGKTHQAFLLPSWRAGREHLPRTCDGSGVCLHVHVEVKDGSSDMFSTESSSR